MGGWTVSNPFKEWLQEKKDLGARFVCSAETEFPNGSSMVVYQCMHNQQGYLGSFSAQVFNDGDFIIYVELDSKAADFLSDVEGANE